jgi:bacteriocin-like protein
MSEYETKTDAKAVTPPSESAEKSELSEQELDQVTGGNGGLPHSGGPVGPGG